MSVIVEERRDSRPLGTDGDGNYTDLELLYSVRGTSDEGLASQSVRDVAPTMWQGLFRKTIEFEPVHIDETNQDACIWTASVKYGTLSPIEQAQQELSYTTSFDTTGGTQHITHSIMTKTPSFGSVTGPLFGPINEAGGGPIGVSGQGSQATVEGVDIVVPVYSWTETHKMTNAQVQANKMNWYNLTGKINSGAFRGFAAGEVLFQGASGSQDETGQWTITFKFAASPNRTGIKVGTITNIAKGGWDYMWVLYQHGEDSSSKWLIPQPLGVYVEQVYESASFNLLGIGS